MPKPCSEARILRQIVEVEAEMPAEWPAAYHWEDAVLDVAIIMSRLRVHLSAVQYAAMLTLGGLLARQHKAELAVEETHPGGSARKYIWIFDTPGDGWDVQFVPRGKSITYDRWFSVRKDARLYAEGLAASTGLPIKDDSTARDEDAEHAAEQAGQLVHELLVRLGKKGGEK